MNDDKPKPLRTASDLAFAKALRGEKPAVRTPAQIAANSSRNKGVNKAEREKRIARVADLMALGYGVMEISATTNYTYYSTRRYMDEVEARLSEKLRDLP